MDTRRTPTIQTGEPNHFFEYYVVFCDSEVIHYPWKLWTRKNFRHCSVYMGVLDGTINMDQTVYGIQTHVWQDRVEDLVDIIKDLEGYTVVYVPHASIQRYRNTLGTIIPTCVSLCQRITGLTSHAFTPYSYYKFLLKNGGHEIMGGKPKQDKGLIEEQKRQLREAREREEAEKAAQEDLNRRRRAGRKSLLGTEGDELGVQ